MGPAAIPAIPYIVAGVAGIFCGAAVTNYLIELHRRQE